MKISIGTFNATNRSVPVTFTVDGKEPFKRDVNAALDDKGSYDRVATKVRVEKEVAPGVQVKFDLDLIGMTPEAPPSIAG
ncbi:MAG TPA: hypothetical protein VF503_20310 [Sphingobium sp.]|uniref:hypothetical protein n=1 Tax=Sphingobium sp. TaxID=1912891 RepID=UPI002ED2D66E